MHGVSMGEAVWSPRGGLGAVGDPALLVAVLIPDPCVEESDHAQLHLRLNKEKKRNETYCFKN